MSIEAESIIDAMNGMLKRGSRLVYGRALSRKRLGWIAVALYLNLGLIAAKFEHDTARPVDGYAAPQLHNRDRRPQHPRRQANSHSRAGSYRP
jgi:hypothetical protein